MYVPFFHFPRFVAHLSIAATSSSTEDLVVSYLSPVSLALSDDATPTATKEEITTAVANGCIKMNIDVRPSLFTSSSTTDSSSSRPTANGPT
jgi:hypothetical protein